MAAALVKYRLLKNIMTKVLGAHGYVQAIHPDTGACPQNRGRGGGAEHMENKREGGGVRWIVSDAGLPERGRLS